MLPCQYSFSISELGLSKPLVAPCRLLLLLRDGTIYFFVMFAVTATITFTWIYATPSLMKVAIGPLIAVSGVSVSLNGRMSILRFG